MLDLQTLYGRKYRIVLDEAANPRTADAYDYELLCKYGKIYVHGPETLAAYTHNRRIKNTLLALQSVVPWQIGDDEAVVLFKADFSWQIERILKPKTRKRISDAHLAALRSGLNRAKGPSGTHERDR